MKKETALFGILIVLFLFTACGAKEDSADSTQVVAVTENSATEESSGSANKAVTTISAPENNNGGFPVESGLVADQILTGADGEIHYSYYLPDNFDKSKKYPLVVVMPGYDMM